MGLAQIRRILRGEKKKRKDSGRISRLTHGRDRPGRKPPINKALAKGKSNSPSGNLGKCSGARGNGNDRKSKKPSKRPSLKEGGGHCVFPGTLRKGGRRKVVDKDSRRGEGVQPGRLRGGGPGTRKSSMWFSRATEGTKKKKKQIHHTPNREQFQKSRNRDQEDATTPHPTNPALGKEERAPIKGGKESNTEAA